MKTLLCLLALGSLGLAGAAEPIVGRVVANELHVRAKPSRESEIVGWLEKNAPVTIIEIKDAWLGVRPPANAKAWVALAALKDNRVMADGTDVRAGPGDVFSAYGKLPKGAQVTVLQTKQNAWAQISPPADAVVWIHSDYVELPPAIRQRLTPPGKPLPPLESGKKGGTDEDAELVKADQSLRGKLPKTLNVRPPEKYEVDALLGEPDTTDVVTFGAARTVTRSGVIIPLPAGKKRPWTYALAALIDTKYYPLLYLGNGYPKLDQWVWHRVTITGEQHWVKDWPRPQVDLKDIQELVDAPAPEKVPEKAPEKAPDQASDKALDNAAPPPPPKP